MMNAKPEVTAALGLAAAAHVSAATLTAVTEQRPSTRRVLKSQSKGTLIKLVERLDRQALDSHEYAKAAIDYAEDLAITLDQVRQALGVPAEPHQGMPERILEAAEHIKGARDRELIEMRDLLTQIRTEMRSTGGCISTKTLGRMQAAIVAAGGAA